MDAQLKEISDKLGFQKSEIVRFMINRSLAQLKTDVIKAGGYDKLDFSIRLKSR